MPDERWWDGDTGEIYWLEITGRDDLGVDLNAPVEREDGSQYWSYDFVREVRDLDVVLHYCTRPKGAITHWSRAAGEAFPDSVTWGALGEASGRGPVEPYRRPGWRHSLDGPYELPEAITKAGLRGQEQEIRAVHDRLHEEHPNSPLYFPFQLSGSRPLRAFQGYLTKFPKALVEALPQLAELSDLAATTEPTPDDPARGAAGPGLGTEYRPADPWVRTAARGPFSTDPDLIDRALQAHALTQEAMAAAVRAAGFAPRSPVPGEPVFDIAWEEGESITVAEIKSLTPRNQEKQLRLALGQVLRYAHLLRQKGKPVRAVIATEYRPAGDSWVALCASMEVSLVWPETFPTLFS